MTLQEYYKEIGDYNDVVGRLINETLIKRFVLKFLDDKSYANLKEAIAAGNYEEAFRHAHTLKGVARNLAFTDVFTLADEITEIFRDMQEHDVSEKMAQLDDAYNKVIQVIEQIKAEG